MSLCARSSCSAFCLVPHVKNARYYKNHFFVTCGRRPFFLSMNDVWLHGERCSGLHPLKSHVKCHLKQSHRAVLFQCHITLCKECVSPLAAAKLCDEGNVMCMNLFMDSYMTYPGISMQFKLMLSVWTVLEYGTILIYYEGCAKEVNSVVSTVILQFSCSLNFVLQ